MTSAFLLDTNIVSELQKRKPSERVTAWMKRNERSAFFVSSLVIGEIRRGIEQLRPRDPDQAATFEAFLEQLIASFDDRILPVTESIAQEWGRMQARATMSQIDALMAATAVVHRMTFVTRNVRDVARAGVPVVNPFED